MMIGAPTNAEFRWRACSTMSTDCLQIVCSTTALETGKVVMPGTHGPQ